MWRQARTNENVLYEYSSSIVCIVINISLVSTLVEKYTFYSLLFYSTEWTLVWVLDVLSLVTGWPTYWEIIYTSDLLANIWQTHSTRIRCYYTPSYKYSILQSFISPSIIHIFLKFICFVISLLQIVHTAQLSLLTTELLRKSKTEYIALSQKKADICRHRWACCAQVSKFIFVAPQRKLRFSKAQMCSLRFKLLYAIFNYNFYECTKLTWPH
jgi:hypothetical protein